MKRALNITRFLTRFFFTFLDFKMASSFAGRFRG